MYFKYFDCNDGCIEIRKVNHVKVLRTRSNVGFDLVPFDFEQTCEIIDAAVQRLAGLLRNEADVFRTIYEMDKNGPYCFRSTQRIMYGYSETDSLAWYETKDEAEAVMCKIAEAIARGDKLFDLTKNQ